jgi:Fanconi anemia group M protein
MSKRLMVQIQNLKQFPRQMLILESSPSSIRIHPNAVRGMLLSIILDFGIPIIFSKSPEESAEFLILLDKRQNKEPHEHSLSMKRIGHTLQERQQIVLESFPGIGPVSAKMLLKKFKTIKRIFDAKKEDLEKHLDSSKVEEIRKILDYPYPD